MSLLKGLKEALEKFGKLEIPRDDRCPAPGLAASILVDSATIPVDIGNISISGIYLVTDKPLTIGNIVPLTLRKKGEPESTELQLSIQVRVIDQQEGGFGLAFVVPTGMKSELWAALMRNLVRLSEQDDVAEAFRLLHTIRFLCSLCPADPEEAMQLIFGGQLDSDRSATLVKVARATETKLAEGADADRMRAHPSLLTNILSEASWATDELNIQLWAGLLVSSCSVNAPDDSNQIFANLLVHLTPTEARIFTRACERALATTPVVETAAAAPESSAPAPAAASSVPEAPARAPEVPATEPEAFRTDSKPSTPAAEEVVIAPEFPVSESSASAPEPASSVPQASAPAAEPSATEPANSGTMSQTSVLAPEFSASAIESSVHAPERSAPASASIIFSPKEMIEATGIYDLYRNATDLAYLFNLGLVRKVFDFTSYHDADSFDVTPSALGIELYKRCHGHRGPLDLQHVKSANAHLANFIPAPQPPAATDGENITPLPTYTSEDRGS